MSLTTLHDLLGIETADWRREPTQVLLAYANALLGGRHVGRRRRVKAYSVLGLLAERAQIMPDAEAQPIMAEVRKLRAVLWRRS